MGWHVLSFSPPSPPQCESATRRQPPSSWKDGPHEHLTSWHPDFFPSYKSCYFPAGSELLPSPQKWWESLTVQPSEAEHSNLLSDVVPGSRGLEGFQSCPELSSHGQNPVGHRLHITCPEWTANINTSPDRRDGTWKHGGLKTLI